jgi:hypothetical protein
MILAEVFQALNHYTAVSVALYSKFRKKPLSLVHLVIITFIRAKVICQFLGLVCVSLCLNLSQPSQTVNFCVTSKCYRYEFFYTLNIFKFIVFKNEITHFFSFSFLFLLFFDLLILIDFG